METIEIILLIVSINIESLENGSFMLPGGKILPKAIEITLDFTAIHEKTLGWQGENFSSDASLYGTESPFDGATAMNANENQAANVNALGGTPTEQQNSDAVADYRNVAGVSRNDQGFFSIDDDEYEGGVPLSDSAAAAFPDGIG